jgi:hypothetical protein
MKPFEILPPVEAKVKVAPRSLDDHVNFVFSRPVNRPLVRRSHILDFVERIRQLLGMCPHGGHDHLASNAAGSELPRISTNSNLPEAIRRFKRKAPNSVILHTYCRLES